MVLVIAVLAVSLFFYRRWKEGPWFSCENIFPTLMVPAIAVFVGIFLAVGVGGLAPKVWTEVGSSKLVSLREESQVKGQFFLGSGSINSRPYFFYYEELGTGGYRPGELPRSPNVIIFEEDRQGGELKVYTPAFRDSFMELVAISARGLDSEGLRHEFRIPRGSIRKDFVLR